jgi:hypothetical protein
MTGTPATASYDGFVALAPTLPSGRAAPAVPTAARDLVELARAAGWLTLVQWCEAADGSPYLSVQLGLREPRHHYQLSWHSFGQLGATDPAGDVSGVRLRLFTRIGSTGGRGQDLPSLKALRHVIDQHRQPLADPGGCRP